MKKGYLIARVLLGVVFFVFGANGLLFTLTGKGFIPMPPPPESMMPIFTGFMATGYLMPLVKILEIISGALLLSGKYVNLALTLLGPVVVNILGIHLFADPSGAPMAIVITALWAFLLKSRWAFFKPLLAKD